MKYSSLIISSNISLFECMNIMELNDEKLLVVCEENYSFKSIVTIGDIQRGILKGKPLNSHVSGVLRNYDDIIFGKESQDEDEIKNLMFNKTIKVMPIVNEDNILVFIYVWSDFFSSKIDKKINENISVILMAGGKGTRLRPLTHQIPKPLIPINKKSISENIMDSFIKFGLEDFVFTINYKAKEIVSYFKDKDYKIKFITEKSVTGTAGSLKLIPLLTDTFIINNCDVLFNIDYKSLVSGHISQKNKITIVSASIVEENPYGVLNIDNNKVVGINEKPKNEYFINTGLYILEKSVIKYIDKEYMDITELIDKVATHGHKVGYFPISSNSWDDMGNWKDYLAICQKNAE